MSFSHSYHFKELSQSIRIKSITISNIDIVRLSKIIFNFEEEKVKNIVDTSWLWRTMKSILMNVSKHVSTLCFKVCFLASTDSIGFKNYHAFFTRKIITFTNYQNDLLTNQIHQLKVNWKKWMGYSVCFYNKKT